MIANSKRNASSFVLASSASSASIFNAFDVYYSNLILNKTQYETKYFKNIRV